MTNINNSKKAAILNILVQQANSIADAGMVVIDDHMHGATRKVDHLVILEVGESLHLCPIVGSICCLNDIEKGEDGYHLTRWSVGGTVHNNGSIFEACDKYNKNQDLSWVHAPECASHIIRVVV